jgi:hypothetical protein
MFLLEKGFLMKAFFIARVFHCAIEAHQVE